MGVRAMKTRLRLRSRYPGGDMSELTSSKRHGGAGRTLLWLAILLSLLLLGFVTALSIRANPYVSNVQQGASANSNLSRNARTSSARRANCRSIWVGSPPPWSRCSRRAGP